jgi:putative transposase
MRWSRIKRRFSQRYLAAGGTELFVSPSRSAKRECGIWQRRFWEHTIRDERDMVKHIEYIHYNPVKHGLASCPHGWPYSSFGRFVHQDLHEADWQCCCEGHTPQAPAFDTLREKEME